MSYDGASDEDLNLKFLDESLPEDRDEVDSISKQVIDFESASAYLPKFFVNSENQAVKQETRRSRTISKGILQKIGRTVPNYQDGVMALLTFSDKLGNEEIKILPLLLGKVCNSTGIMVVYHSMNHVILHMETKSYMLLGGMIVKECGLGIQNMIVTHLEAISLDSLPSCFVELLTPKSSGEAIQRELSNVLVTFCGSFSYLRLIEECEADIKPTKSPVSITLMFSKRSQRNTDKLAAILSGQDSPWVEYQPADGIRSSFEQLFSLQGYSAPLLGMMSGCDVPGVRISVMFSTKKDEMQTFYRALTGKTPVCRSQQGETVHMIYPIATHMEFQLIYNPTLHTEASSNIAICVRITDHEKISAVLSQPLTSLDIGLWETFDPVGNRVRLFTPVE